MLTSNLDEIARKYREGDKPGKEPDKSVGDYSTSRHSTRKKLNASKTNPEPEREMDHLVDRIGCKKPKSRKASEKARTDTKCTSWRLIQNVVLIQKRIFNS